MIAFGHSSVGAIIGVVATVAFAPSTPLWLQLVIVLVAGIISHYLFDVIPHGHYGANIKKFSNIERAIFILDTLGAFAFLAWLALAASGPGRAAGLVVTAMVGALLPDIWEGLIELGRIPLGKFAKKHRHFHFYTIHWHRHTGPQIPGRNIRAMGLIDTWQVVVFIIAVLLLLTLAPT